MNARIQTRHVVCAIVLFAFRAVVASWFAELQRCETPSLSIGLFAALTGDAPSYLEPIENWLRDGQYYWFNGERRVYAGRTPHYGLVYLSLRLFWPFPLAAEGLVLLQLLVSSIADVVLAYSCEKLTRAARFGYWAALCLVATNLYPVHNAARLVPESLALSLVTAALCQSTFPPKTALGHLAYGGSLALAGCLRPYLLPLLGYALVRSLFDGGPVLRRTVLLGLPLAGLLLPWTARNLWVLGRFVPLQESPYAGYAGYGEAYLAYRSWMGAWGGNPVYWDQHSPGCYFEPDNLFPCQLSSVPAAALAGNSTRQAVEEARAALRLSRTDPDQAERARLAFGALTADIRRSAPLVYWFVAPLRVLRDAFAHSGSYWMPVGFRSACATRLSALVKLQQSLLYYGILGFGVAALIVLAARRQAPGLWLFVPVSLFLVLCLGFRLAESRYFNAMQPVCCLAIFRLWGGTVTRALRARGIGTGEAASGATARSS